jgi:hypothetical protein
MHVLIVFVFVPGSISLPYVVALVVDPKYGIICLENNNASLVGFYLIMG